MSARLALVATGGTIACTLDEHGRAVKTLRAADLLARAGRPGDGVAAIDSGLVSSWDLTPPAMLEVARLAEQVGRERDGVVVTQGTCTPAEAAALPPLA